MPDLISGAFSFVLGSVVAGFSATLLGVAWALAVRWEAPSAARQVARALSGFVAAAGLLAGAVLVTLGLERAFGSPLGRWSGASMILDLWIALELWTRDQVLTAALAGRRTLWILPATTWVATKAAQVLTAFVALWAWLGL
ncbi:MAG TPA: hypothetical protein RMH99_16650 [Sandaracinaceae bacterium LLY-WYZ-13_1]|nr:hypothetical protein [Sandaracinaceae bacterium LLY-WYZ-13_1]